MHQNDTTHYQIYGITLRTNQRLPILPPVSTTATADVEVNLAEGDLSALSHQDNEYDSGWQTQQKVDGTYYYLSLRGSSETLNVEIAQLESKFGLLGQTYR